MRRSKSKKKSRLPKPKISARRDSPSFKQRLLGALPFMLSAILLTAFLSLTGGYRAFETSFC